MAGPAIPLSAGDDPIEEGNWIAESFSNLDDQGREVKTWKGRRERRAAAITFYP